MSLLSCYHTGGREASAYCKFRMWTVSLSVYFFVCFMRSTSPTAADARMASLATEVYNDIFKHSDGKDTKNNAITYLYMHEDALPMSTEIHANYTNANITDIFQRTKARIPTVTAFNPPVYPTDMDGNLIIGTVKAANETIRKLDTIDNSICPELVILGRGKFGNKQHDVYGWPPSFLKAKDAFQAKCPNTLFFYYVHVKPRAEMVLESLEKNNVTVIYSSDFSEQKRNSFQ